MAQPWSPQSWQGLTALQQPEYPDPGELEAVLANLRTLPGLVGPGEVDRLRTLLSEAAQGKRFLLQGGDCAERFRDCHGEAIADKLRILLRMSVVLTHAGRCPVVRVLRLAGQYAKPRSAGLETVGGRELPVYRGDLINALEATPEARAVRPARMQEAYFHAAATLNHLRSLIEDGFADLHHPERWDLPGRTGELPAYQEVIREVRATLDFLEALGGARPGALERIELFTSHEALLLPFEAALTRWIPERQAWYNLSAGMVWVGERTRALDGAHLEYLRGLRNPLGVKLGPSAKPEDLPDLLAKLDPDREPGRLTLITRFGAEAIRGALPPLIQAVQATGHPVLWSCDPMHGNTTSVEIGLSPEQDAEGHRAPGAALGAVRRKRTVKTRDFGAILSELSQAFELHRAHGSRLGGVHFELTGEEVTECVGGSQGLTEADLPRAYETGCDPRLNGAQSLEMAFLIARML